MELKPSTPCASQRSKQARSPMFFPWRSSLMTTKCVWTLWDSHSGWATDTMNQLKLLTQHAVKRTGGPQKQPWGGTQPHHGCRSPHGPGASTKNRSLPVVGRGWHSYPVEQGGAPQVDIQAILFLQVCHAGWGRWHPVIVPLECLPEI